MSNGGSGAGWSAGKVVLLIAAILGGLLMLCCVVSYFVIWPKVESKFESVQALTEGQLAFDEAFGRAFPKGSVWQIQQYENQTEFVVVLGLPSEPAADEIAEFQDELWEVYAVAFAESGFPVTGVAVGTAVSRIRGGGKGQNQGQADGWAKNIETVDVVVQRTGIPQPTVNELMDWAMSLAKEGAEAPFEPIEVEVKPSTPDEAEESTPKPDEPDEGE